MTNRENILRALRREQPGKMPVPLFCKTAVAPCKELRRKRSNSSIVVCANPMNVTLMQSIMVSATQRRVKKTSSCWLKR